MFKTRKKHFAIFGFCLFFYDVIIFAENFGEFPIRENLAILKRCHVLYHNLVISRADFTEILHGDSLYDSASTICS